jgi:hypothetical protein
MEGTSYVFLHLCEYLVFISCESAIITFCLFNLVIKMGKCHLKLEDLASVFQSCSKFIELISSLLNVKPLRWLNI